MYKILFAEDDESLGYLVREELAKNQHEIVWAKDGTECLQHWEKSNFDICLLDIMMPNMDGFEVARSIRKRNSEIPIIFLTARSMEEDRLMGFEIGGDDYIIKPFSMKELCYRIDACLRRSKLSKMAVDQLSISDTTLEYKNNRLLIKKEEISLTQREAAILKILIENKNNLLRREKILVEIWGENDYFKGRSLDVFITRIRKILKEDDGLEIRNSHGSGFMLIEKAGI